MNKAVAKWTLDGRVFVWRYRGNPRNHSGWHLTADQSGCDALLYLFDLMSSSDYSSKTRFQLTPPDHTELSVANAHQEHRAAEFMTLAYAPTKMPPDHWCLQEAAGTIELELGRAMLDELREGLVDISQGNGDYCIGHDGQELWFWWR